jgi:hypothetical protein
MPDAKPAMKIDHLLLNIPGGSAAQGQQVAALVAAGLAASGALPQSGDIPSLHVTIRANERNDPDSLARLIVAETLRALARVP